MFLGVIKLACGLWRGENDGDVTSTIWVVVWFGFILTVMCFCGVVTASHSRVQEETKKRGGDCGEVGG